MALLPGRSFFLALAAGVAGGAIATMLRQNDGRFRPAAKNAIRAGLSMLEQARQTVGEVAETATDLLAEAQAELEEERRRGESPPAPAAEHVVPIESRAVGDSERKAHG